ncbi:MULTISPECIES: carbon-nitrogen hydrolase family protein [Roseobacteraceae]|uniref:(R)-stereoselective amidase n=1 Tax=Pseudosulfitobacter pseudonitzschiae TaxID=1402135 RepID=A0A221K6C1_9RHOB|nr:MULTISPECIES: carbon-nitrogen hydrolase family protein [Roseobacteraceae]ASM74515.1 (R)-stereoselective amidase [Pseudosulfitobacter pseudonitzschiae]
MRIACMQIAPLASDVAGSLDLLEDHAAKAKAADCDLLVTPEMYLTGYNIGAARVQQLAQPVTGPSAERVAEIARRNGLAILYGYPEKDPDGGAAFNSVQLIDQSGNRIANYRKTHLYGDVDRAQFQAGDARAPVILWHGWKVALAICYDIEFPELTRAYALGGAELVLTPTANMIPYDSVATRLVPARAEENGLFVVYANYCGTEAAFDYCGLSCVCGPDGRDVARAGRGPGLIVADLDRSEIAQTRQAVRYLTDRRPEIYNRTVQRTARDDT